MNVFSKKNKELVLVLATFSPIFTWMGVTGYTGCLIDMLAVTLGGLGQTYVSLWTIVTITRED
tara:strand:+ start:106 stop:294 length:189 start_codon:yes stop_codon:yes gene_type:complete